MPTWVAEAGLLPSIAVHSKLEACKKQGTRRLEILSLADLNHCQEENADLRFLSGKGIPCLCTYFDMECIPA